ADLDEAFHCQLLAAAGNREMARVHAEVCDRIRIVRRLDFLKSARIEETYNEHGLILQASVARRRDEAQMLLRSHIEQSTIEERQRSLGSLAGARNSGRQACEVFTIATQDQRQRAAAIGPLGLRAPGYEESRIAQLRC